MSLIGSSFQNSNPLLFQDSSAIDESTESDYLENALNSQFGFELDKLESIINDASNINQSSLISSTSQEQPEIDIFSQEINLEEINYSLSIGSPVEPIKIPLLVDQIYNSLNARIEEGTPLSQQEFQTFEQGVITIYLSVRQYGSRYAFDRMAELFKITQGDERKVVKSYFASLFYFDLEFEGIKNAQNVSLTTQQIFEKKESLKYYIQNTLSAMSDVDADAKEILKGSGEGFNVSDVFSEIFAEKIDLEQDLVDPIEEEVADTTEDSSF